MSKASFKLTALTLRVNIASIEEWGYTDEPSDDRTSHTHSMFRRVWQQRLKRAILVRTDAIRVPARND